MKTDSGRILRFATSAALACVVVAALMVASLWAFGIFDREEGHRAVDISLLSVSERVDLAELLGERSPDERPTLPPLEEIEPLEIPRRSESGFVQVEFSVDDAGNVTDAQVVRAMPTGLFEDQALEIVRSRRYQPGGETRMTEIVDFSVEPEDP